MRRIAWAGLAALVFIGCENWASLEQGARCDAGLDDCGSAGGGGGGGIGGGTDGGGTGGGTGGGGTGGGGTGGGGTDGGGTGGGTGGGGTGGGGTDGGGTGGAGTGDAGTGDAGTGDAGTGDAGTDAGADGGCGPCAADGGEPANMVRACVSGGCGLVCQSLWGDCDNTLTNGCEYDLSYSRTDCGACGFQCGNANATATCAAGVCQLTCLTGYADCDGDPRNGCEADLVSQQHCGACGVSCASDAGAQCVSSGSCRLTGGEIRGAWNGFNGLVADNTALYWVNPASDPAVNAVRRVNKTGDNLMTLYTANDFPPVLGNTRLRPGIAVDQTRVFMNPDLYSAIFFLAAKGTHQTVTQIGTTATTQGTNPNGLYVDVTDGGMATRVWWVGATNQSGTWSAVISSGMVTHHDSTPNDIVASTRSDTELFFAYGSAQGWRIAHRLLDGSGAATVSGPKTYQPHAMAWGGGTLYVFGSDGQFHAIDSFGNDTVVGTCALASPTSGLAVWGTTLYLANVDLWRLRLVSGSMPACEKFVAREASEFLNAVVVDANNVYFASQPSVYRKPH